MYIKQPQAKIHSGNRHTQKKTWMKHAINLYKTRLISSLKS